MRNPLSDLQANISNKVATLAHEVTHLPRLNQLLKIHRYTVNDDMAKLVLVLQTALSIFEHVSCQLYYISRSMIEVSEAIERTLKLCGCEVHELLDVVLICKDVESSVDQKSFCILSAGPLVGIVIVVYLKPADDGRSGSLSSVLWHYLVFFSDPSRLLMELLRLFFTGLKGKVIII